MDLVIPMSLPAQLCALPSAIPGSINGLECPGGLPRGGNMPPLWTTASDFHLLS